ncbi:MAG: response regulator [Gemmatimonas sp.]|jgi:CheY-like chemotaxis protein|uniref:response regulator n=1 Tax=Gemmatimonas sp. TaxID=1962908 RepID=UPI00391F41FC|nr:response regulator [Gemmatimonadota bacterium]
MNDLRSTEKSGPELAINECMKSEGSNRAVLIVEDEASIRDVLVELFEVDGNAVTAAALLPEALEKLRTQRFDLIVTDLRLGGKRDGGLQVMALAGMLSPDAMVLVLTAYPDDANRQASFRLGALHFLEKPVDLATIAQHASTVGVRTAFAESTRE